MNVQVVEFCNIWLTIVANDTSLCSTIPKWTDNNIHLSNRAARLPGSYEEALNTSKMEKAMSLILFFLIFQKKRQTAWEANHFGDDLI